VVADDGARLGEGAAACGVVEGAEQRAGRGDLCVGPVSEVCGYVAGQVVERVPSRLVEAEVAGCSGEAVLFEVAEESGDEGRGLCRGAADRVADSYDARGDTASGQGDFAVFGGRG
jgi:hypothetical protein